ncbi:MAG: amino acid ABC transporter permease [Stackebrandtia sp.]
MTADSDGESGGAVAAAPDSAERPQLHPGLSPRRRNQISRTIQYAVLVVAAVAIGLMADWVEVVDKFFRPEYIGDSMPKLFVVGLVNTVLYTVSAYAIGFVLGIFVALMRMSSAAPNRWIATVFIEVFRGLPALLVLVLFAFFLPVAYPGFQLPFGSFGTVALGLGLVAAAYMAETFRAGIQAVPKGQMEASRSLGMSYTRAMFTVILPQATRIVIPPLTNEAVLLTKDTSLVFAIGVMASEAELLKFGTDLANEKGNATPLLLAGLTYLTITVPLSFAVRRLEARQAKAR